MTRMTPLRARIPYSGLALAVSAILGGCLFGDSPANLNDEIDSGKAAKALSTIEEKLATAADDPALNLLAAKARLALCIERACTSGAVSGTLPSLLQPVPGLLGKVHEGVVLDKKHPPLTAAGVLSGAIPGFAGLPGQPGPVLTLYGTAPAALQPQAAQALFVPALNMARTGQYRQAGQVLSTLAAQAEVPSTYASFARVINGLFTNTSDLSEPYVISLRSAPANPPLPDAAAGLVPWAVLADAQTRTSDTAPATTALTSLPAVIKNWQWAGQMDAAAQKRVGAELVAIADTPTLRAQWQRGWGGASSLPLSLKQTALTLNPDQPELWESFLPQLVSASLVSGSTGPGIGPMTLPVATLTSATGQVLGTQLLNAATQLGGQPATAVPLVVLAGQMPLSRPQQVALEKLAQDILIKVSAAGDVTSTVLLAQAQPGVAMNNRQAVVPLVVKQIREDLRNADFDSATAKADLLTDTLKLDVELGPIILQEFADELKRRKVADELVAKTPDVLLEAPEDAEMDLGPLFGFLQEYFEKQPDVISLQLTTLIAQAQGPYGQPTAMYRLGHLFPEATMPEAKRQNWLAASLTEALVADKSYNGPQLAQLAEQLAARHPALSLPALAEEAVKRATTLEDQRTLWQQASPEFKAVLKAIRPEFSALMRAADALDASKFSTAAQELALVQGSSWATQAGPFFSRFRSKLVGIAGVYVPVSGAAAGKTGAIMVVPAGLLGGPLEQVSVTFINRIGTLAEEEATNMRTNAAAVRGFTLGAPVNFDTMALAVTRQALAAVPHGGAFGATYGSLQKLSFQPSAEGIGGPTLLQTSGSDAAANSMYVRAVVGAQTPLRPDGSYLMETRVGQPVSGTEGILPPGSLLTLETAEETESPLPGDDTTAARIYPLTGELRHPAAPEPLEVKGFFDPATLTSTFTFSYPLPQSRQPVKAAARCQALAGPIVCGVHNLHSPRQAYATFTAGLQTRESLAEASNQRAEDNLATTDSLSAAAAVVASPTAPLIDITQAISGTQQLIAVSASAAVSPAEAVSATANVTPTGVFIHNGTVTQAEEPALPAAFHEDASSTTPPPGVFIHRTSGNNEAAAPTGATPAPGTPAAPAPAAPSTPAPAAPSAPPR